MNLHPHPHKLIWQFSFLYSSFFTSIHILLILQYSHYFHNPTLAEIEESDENTFKFFQVAGTTAETNTDDEVLEAEESDSAALEARFKIPSTSLEKENEKRQ